MSQVAFQQRKRGQAGGESRPGNRPRGTTISVEERSCCPPARKVWLFGEILAAPVTPGFLVYCSVLAGYIGAPGSSSAPLEANTTVIPGTIPASPEPFPISTVPETPVVSRTLGGTPVATVVICFCNATAIVAVTIVITDAGTLKVSEPGDPHYEAELTDFDPDWPERAGSSRLDRDVRW